jgi:flavin-dependent dehydrogenase
MMDQHEGKFAGGTKLMNNKEIMTKYPGFENLPDNYVGYEVVDSGVIRVKEALNALKELSEKQGAEMRYKTEVKSIKKDEVTLKDGTVVRGKHVVCCAGPLSVGFDTSKHKKQIEVREVEYHVLSNPKGFPFAFSEFFPDQSLNFGLKEGDKMDQYKIGSDEVRNFTKILPWLKE